MISTISSGLFRLDLGHRGRRLEHRHLKRLGAAAALGHAELHPLTRPQCVRGGFQRSGVHKDLTAVVTGEEAEALVDVIPLDLASRHERDLTRGGTISARGAEASACYQAIGCGPFPALPVAQ